MSLEHQPQRFSHEHPNVNDLVRLKLYKRYLKVLIEDLLSLGVQLLICLHTFKLDFLAGRYGVSYEVLDHQNKNLAM